LWGRTRWHCSAPTCPVREQRRREPRPPDGEPRRPGVCRQQVAPAAPSRGGWQLRDARGPAARPGHPPVRVRDGHVRADRPWGTAHGPRPTQRSPTCCCAMCIYHAELPLTRPSRRRSPPVARACVGPSSCCTGAPRGGPSAPVTPTRRTCSGCAGRDASGLSDVDWDLGRAEAAELSERLIMARLDRGPTPEAGQAAM
jgi:hypothetical protein